MWFAVNLDPLTRTRENYTTQTHDAQYNGKKIDKNVMQARIKDINAWNPLFVISSFYEQTRKKRLWIVNLSNDDSTTIENDTLVPNTINEHMVTVLLW